MCCGGSGISHVNDAGFWLVNQYYGMTVPVKPSRVADDHEGIDLHSRLSHSVGGSSVLMIEARRA